MVIKAWMTDKLQWWKCLYGHWFCNQNVSKVDRYSGITGYKVKNEFVYQFISLQVHEDDSLQIKISTVSYTHTKKLEKYIIILKFPCSKMCHLVLNW